MPLSFAFLYEKRTHPHTLDMRCHDNGCRFPFCPTMRLMESNRIRMSPCIRPYACALTPCALALPTPHLGANPPEPNRCCRPRRRPTISDSLCRTEKRYSSPSPVYATIIHAFGALVKPFLLFLYCFLAVLPIDFRIYRRNLARNGKLLLWMGKRMPKGKCADKRAEARFGQLQGRR